MSDRPQIAVIGAASCDERRGREAREVGREIGRAGAILLCGGGGGVMAEAAAGARTEGGLTIGILPGRDAASSPPNPDIEVAVYTGIGQARNQVLVLSAGAVVGVGGGWGTLSEIGLALKHGIPVTLLGSWDLERPDGVAEPLLRRASSAREAVETALRAMGLGRATEEGARR